VHMIGRVGDDDFADIMMPLWPLKRWYGAQAAQMDSQFSRT